MLPDGAEGGGSQVREFDGQHVRIPIWNELRPDPSRNELADDGRDLHQPPFGATAGAAAVCRRPLGRRADPNGRAVTILSDFPQTKNSSGSFQLHSVGRRRAAGATSCEANCKRC